MTEREFFLKHPLLYIAGGGAVFMLFIVAMVALVTLLFALTGG